MKDRRCLTKKSGVVQVQASTSAEEHQVDSSFFSKHSLGLIYTYRQCHHFSYRLKMGKRSSMVLFKHNVEKIKGAPDESGDFDGTCEEGFN